MVCINAIAGAIKRKGSRGSRGKDALLRQQ